MRYIIEFVGLKISENMKHGQLVCVKTKIFFLLVVSGFVVVLLVVRGLVSGFVSNERFCY